MAPLSRRTLLAALGTALPAAALQDAPFAAPAGKPGRTERTQFAVNLEMWFTRMPFLERVEAAADLGFPALEFWPWQGKPLDALAALCARLKIDIAQFLAWGFSPGLNDPANHDAFEAAIRGACDAGDTLGVSRATVVAGNDRAGVSKEEMHAQVIAGLRRVAPIVEARDFTLLLEPMNGRVDHPGHCLYGSIDGVRICDEVGSSHVKLNWDLYHMQLAEGDLCGHLRDGFHQLGYVQVADTPGRREPGTGEIHYPRVFKQLWDLGYRGYVGLECNPTGDEFLAAQHAAESAIF